MSEKSTFYLVREEILPEAIKKTIKVKEILKRGEIKTINEAVEKMGLSRSAYYKYKDYIFLPNEFNQQKAIISLDLSHEKGTLSKVLNTLSDFNTNILTISQALPINNVANVNISLDILNINNSLDDLIKALGNIKGVINAQLINLE